MQKRLKSLSFLNAYPKDAYVFMFASFMNSTGSALMWPLITLYVHNVLHRSYGEAGLVLFFQSFASMLGQFAGGGLYYKLGVKNLVIGSLILQGCAQIGLILAKAWLPYVGVMALNGFLMAITMPTISAFIGFRWPKQQYRLFNVIYVSNNAGVAVGTTLAGILAAFSFNLTFALNGLSTFAFAAFFFVYFRRIDLSHGNNMNVGLSPYSEETSTWTLLKNYRLYLFISLGSLLIWFSTSSWNSAVAPYLNQKGMSLSSYSFLWTLNGLMILFGQPATTVYNRFVAKSLGSRLISSAFFYALAFFFMWVCHGAYYDFVIGMLVATLGEMLISPSIPALVAQTTGASAPFYLGLVGGFGSVGRLAGPVLFGNLFDMFGISPILLLTTAATFMAVLFFVVQKRLLHRQVA